MKIELVFQGFPGKLTRGYMGWSSVVYIEVGETKIVFDTGGPVKRCDLRARLKELGTSADEIDILVLSHFHDDHVYSLDYFSKARILLHAKEASWVLSDPDAFSIPKHLYPALASTGRLQLISDDVEIAPGVQTMLVPGHTPGSMALVLREDNKPTTVLAGDAVKNLAELASGTVGMSLDNEASARSISKIRDLADVVIPGHDRMLQVEPDRIVAGPAVHETIVLAPGIVDRDRPKCFELVIEPSWLPRT
jgi:glyoxylase-like metal-dependent hydrolase (beta-lactamase superfamily II)